MELNSERNGTGLDWFELARGPRLQVSGFDGPA